MNSLFLKFTILMLACGGLATGVAAQIDEQCPHIKPMLSVRDGRGTRIGGVREQLIKLCIEENKREFEELVERTEEIAKLSDEIMTSFEQSNALSNDDKEKLERVDELLKKVRSELRADDDDEDKALPADAVEAIQLLQQSAGSLLSEIKKTTRHSVSLIAIKSSNTVKKIVKFLRFGN